MRLLFLAVLFAVVLIAQGFDRRATMRNFASRRPRPPSRDGRLARLAEQAAEELEQNDAVNGAASGEVGDTSQVPVEKSSHKSAVDQGERAAKEQPRDQDQHADDQQPQAEEHVEAEQHADDQQPQAEEHVEAEQHADDQQPHVEEHVKAEQHADDQQPQAEEHVEADQEPQAEERVEAEQHADDQQPQAEEHVEADQEPQAEERVEAEQHADDQQPQAEEHVEADQEPQAEEHVEAEQHADDQQPQVEEHVEAEQHADHQQPQVVAQNARAVVQLPAQREDVGGKPQAGGNADSADGFPQEAVAGASISNESEATVHPRSQGAADEASRISSKDEKSPPAKPKKIRYKFDESPPAPAAEPIIPSAQLRRSGNIHAHKEVPRPKAERPNLNHLFPPVDKESEAKYARIRSRVDELEKRMRKLAQVTHEASSGEFHVDLTKPIGHEAPTRLEMLESKVQDLEALAADILVKSEQLLVHLKLQNARVRDQEHNEREIQQRQEQERQWEEERLRREQENERMRIENEVLRARRFEEERERERASQKKAVGAHSSSSAPILFEESGNLSTLGIGAAIVAILSLVLVMVVWVGKKCLCKRPKRKSAGIASTPVAQQPAGMFQQSAPLASQLSPFPPAASQQQPQSAQFTQAAQPQFFEDTWSSPQHQGEIRNRAFSKWN